MKSCCDVLKISLLMFRRENLDLILILLLGKHWYQIINFKVCYLSISTKILDRETACERC